MGDINQLAKTIIGCAIDVHRHPAPDLPENAYEEALCIELEQAHVLTYLKATGKKTGLLINFNARLLREGVKRFIL